MKSSDQHQLENAYQQILDKTQNSDQQTLVAEPATETTHDVKPEDPAQLTEGLKGAVAAGLMGLGAMGGLKGADIPYHTSL